MFGINIILVSCDHTSNRGLNWAISGESAHVIVTCSVVQEWLNWGFRALSPATPAVLSSYYHSLEKAMSPSSVTCLQGMTDIKDGANVAPGVIYWRLSNLITVIAVRTVPGKTSVGRHCPTAVLLEVILTAGPTPDVWISWSGCSFSLTLNYWLVGSVLMVDILQILGSGFYPLWMSSCSSL